ncbi:thiamine pyrophosphate-dependent enzyme [Calderihabitans maritimus]|uniref:2-oxoacid:ferredoxin oxidoreductase subunit beta n=1 Tax=Calderihabitans maritimus TaxID=1246530 RepID=A0A1Z5HQ66_9FIRM|nr:thiamine pyrophosphate-dependent enzyme [Calderihabitans maritimus]GAW91461.1 2-oxoacid:ferredoxin oxidoreductase subunit beta [Calderihabitans maritimus]
MSPKEVRYGDYIAWENLPHLWCAGCGHGVILKAITMAAAELAIPKEKLVLATGIGCSGRSGDYVTCHRFQGTHGRTLAFATGIKLARPDVTVICLMGDGDGAAIGGNHLLHAARRNIDVTAVIANNLNYGMTGGQFSPATPLGSVTSTSRSGKTEATMDLCALADVAGANFVARTTVYHVREVQRFIERAIKTKGFSMVEVLTPCPTYYGRYNEIGDSVGMLNWFKNRTLPLEKYQALPPEEKKNYFWRGIMVERERPDFLETYRSSVARRSN